LASDSYAEIGDILAGKWSGGELRIRGWLHNARSGGGIRFLLIRDGTGVLQCTLKKDQVPAELFERIGALPLESTLELLGKVRPDSRAPGGYELSVANAQILSVAKDDFPIGKKSHGPDFLLNNRHLWIRSQKMQTILRVRAKLLEAAREWLTAEGWTEAHAPTLITAACEGGSTLFEVKYFDSNAYLTQSWQLYAEAMIASLGRIYTIQPSFRAEHSRTRRHLTEYWHLELEAPWYGLKEIMETAESLVSHIACTVADEVADKLRHLGRDPERLKVKPPFPRLTYDEAITKLNELDIETAWGEDLTWEKEQHLSALFDRPFFVTHYPRKAKAFYHKPDPARPEVTLSADMLAPERYGEIIGGGERIDDLEELVMRMDEDGLNTKDYSWYLDLRKYGSVPHAGFGLGIERTLVWICGLKHIRDAIPFPRLVNRIYP